MQLVLSCITSYFCITSFLPANDDNLEDGKGENDVDQQQKETRTNVKHDATKNKKKVFDPEATAPSRKLRRLKDQVSPSSPKPEAEKKTKTKNEAVSDRQAEDHHKTTKRKKKAEKAAPKEVLILRKLHQRKLQAVDKQKKRKICEPKQSEDVKRKKKEKQIESSESEEEDEEE
ncbi:protein pxr-1-like [Papaver somniferum]|uniref:protein pxr-1-like n=1 Tax=Papaver somniferum TaxID=3469 RepID=UPI000E6F67FC|nr:protein pxr-1-like [Papaver somniferum]